MVRIHLGVSPIPFEKSLARPHIRRLNALFTPDCVVGLYSQRSHGVIFEIATAWHKAKPAGQAIGAA